MHSPFRILPTAALAVAVFTGGQALAYSCEDLANPVHQRLCTCQQTISATDRLDCYDVMAREAVLEHVALADVIRGMLADPDTRELMRKELAKTDE